MNTAEELLETELTDWEIVKESGKFSEVLENESLRDEIYKFANNQPSDIEGAIEDAIEEAAYEILENQL